MTNNKSILWDDSTLQHDEAVVEALVEKIVVGDQTHKKKCVDKIMATIKTKAWQRNYPQRIFVFNILYSLDVHIIEISFSFHAQVVDALYFTISRDLKARNKRFDDKFNFVFEHIYGRKPTRTTSDALRILRNNVMHTGSINGIPPVIKTEDKRRLSYVCRKYKLGKSNRGATALAAEFDYLINDLVIRVLGLEWDDLSRNGRPPSWSVYFNRAKKLRS